MSILSGQDSALQIGLAGAWGKPYAATRRLHYTQESLKGALNYKESDALVGAKTTVSMAAMSQKASGGFTCYVTPDTASLLFFLALGKELATVASGTQKDHAFVPVPSGVLNNLPAFTAEVDRILEKGLYASCKMSSWSVKAQAEDYAMFECECEAHSENLQDPLVHTYVGTFVNATGVITLPDAFIPADGTFVGRTVRLYKADGTEFHAKITASVAAAKTITVSAYGKDTALPAAMDSSWTCDILDWIMTPDATNHTERLPLSTQEYFKFAHARCYLEGGQTEYVVKSTGLGMGKAGDKVLGVPLTVNGTTGALIVQANNNRGEPCLFKYTGAVLTRTTLLTLTFDDALTTDGYVKSIYSAAGVLNSAAWQVYEELYDEVTDITISGDNNLNAGKFGANGSMYQREVQPQKRSFTVDLTATFTKRYSELRKRKYNKGSPMKVRLYFSTQVNDMDGPLNTSIDSTGNPYILWFDLPSCYLTDGLPNIGGPDEPTVNMKLQAREVVGVQEALTVHVVDDLGAVAGFQIQGVASVARTDGN